MEDYREIGPPGNGETRKTGASNLAAVRETTRHVRIHASRVIFRGALKSPMGQLYQSENAVWYKWYRWGIAARPRPIVPI